MTDFLPLLKERRVCWQPQQKAPLETLSKLQPFYLFSQRAATANTRGMVMNGQLKGNNWKEKRHSRENAYLKTENTNLTQKILANGYKCGLHLTDQKRGKKQVKT